MKVRVRLAKLCLLYLFAVVFGLWGFAAAYFKVFPFAILHPVFEETTAFLKGTEEDGKTVLQRITQHSQVRPLSREGTGFTIHDKDFIDPGYLLLSYYTREFDQVVIDLIRIRDHRVLHRWIPPIREILKKSWKDEIANSRENYRAQHPFLMENGDLVFTSGEGPLVRISPENEIVWILNNHFHHSIERNHDGNLLVCATIDPALMPFPSGLRDDGWVEVSPEGKVLRVFSATSILIRNGFRGLALGVSTVEPDRIHLNDAQPVLQNRGVAQVGDVALSSRTLSTVLLYRPNEDRIVWLKTGPWLKQHDINLLKDGRFSVFGNDFYFLDTGIAERIDDHSEVYIYDPVTNEIETPFSKIFNELNMSSQTEGRSRILPNDDVFVEETNHNRLIRTSPKQVRWTYVNRVSERSTGALHWTRYLTPEEVFLDWLDLED